MSELVNQLTKFREEYYITNKKNVFFKKTQKNDCAEKVTQQFSLEHLLQTSIYINNNVLFFNYPIIKTYLYPGVYNSIITHSDKLFNVLIQTHETINIHIDLKSFTVTAAQRHNEIIKEVCKHYLTNETYIARIEHIYIQNSPAIIDVIRSMFAPFISSTVQNKISFISS
jgi:hypothetical protein